MRILVVGKGGREHALATAMARDTPCNEFMFAPGNPGMAELGECVAGDMTNGQEMAALARRFRPDLVFVGPEDPLAAGVVDFLEDAGFCVFGPRKSAAQIESSKAFAKSLFTRSGVPTPFARICSDLSEGRSAIETNPGPWVIKASGLAAGKGVTIAQDRMAAERALRAGIARGDQVLVEEFIDGWEFSLMVTTVRGRVAWTMPIFQDYKPVFDGDIGANTGGMGVITPVPSLTPALQGITLDEIVCPTIAALDREGLEFRGTLCLNAIYNRQTGKVMALEFNARFGDPEAQGLAPLIRSGLTDHFAGIASGERVVPDPILDSEASVCIAVAGEGYPTNPIAGDVIEISPPSDPLVSVFHAGTTVNDAGELTVGGGRVLNVVARGPDLETARRHAYDYLKAGVRFRGMHFRRDIGDLSIERGRPIER